MSVQTRWGKTTRLQYLKSIYRRLWRIAAPFSDLRTDLIQIMTETDALCGGKGGGSLRGRGDFSRLVSESKA